MNSVQATISALREKSLPRPVHAELKIALGLFESAELISAVERFPRRGRPGHPRTPLVNAHLVGCGAARIHCQSQASS